MSTEYFSVTRPNQHKQEKVGLEKFTASTIEANCEFEFEQQVQVGVQNGPECCCKRQNN